MAVESSKDTGEDQVEALVDDLIRDIFSESGGPADSSMRGMATAALLERALGSVRGTSRASMLERVLIAEVFATELAEALAPALADQLAPRLMKAFEQMSAEASDGKQPSARSSGQRRRTSAKLSGQQWARSSSCW